MMDGEISNSVEFESTGSILIGRFTCNEIITPDTIDELLEEFKKRIEGMSEKHLLIDFSKITFVATSAINMLLILLKRMRIKGGEVYLCAITENVRQLFDLMQLDRLFVIYPNRTEAVKKIGA